MSYATKFVARAIDFVACASEVAIMKASSSQPTQSKMYIFSRSIPQKKLI